jgi:hypothetical protein
VGDLEFLEGEAGGHVDSGVVLPANLRGPGWAEVRIWLVLL